MILVLGPLGMSGTSGPGSSTVTDGAELLLLKKCPLSRPGSCVLIPLYIILQTRQHEIASHHNMRE